MADTIHLLSVNVGAREVIDVWPDKLIESGIRKRPVDEPSILLGELGLEGDHQADQRRIRGVQVHGGPGKALYAYPSEHFDDWRAELGQDIGAGAFGENLTTRGVTEADACIGDVWRWGDALLQITEPRGPCYKLDIHRGDERTGKLMNASGHTGWYLRVLQPARVQTTGTIEISERHSDGLSVLDVHRIFRGGDEGALTRLLDVEPLGSDLKQMIQNRLKARARAQAKR